MRLDPPRLAVCLRCGRFQTSTLLGFLRWFQELRGEGGHSRRVARVITLGPYDHTASARLDEIGLEILTKCDNNARVGRQMMRIPQA